MWHLTLLAITEASSYSHEGPLRPPKLMGKDKAVPVAVVENSMAARRDNPFDMGQRLTHVPAQDAHDVTLLRTHATHRATGGRV